MKKTTKLKKILEAITPESDKIMGGFDAFDKSVASLRDNLKNEVVAKTLDEVNGKIDDFRKKIDIQPLILNVDSLKTEFKNREQDILLSLDAKSQEIYREINLIKNSQDSESSTNLSKIKDLENQISSLNSEKNIQLEDLKNLMGDGENSLKSQIDNLNTLIDEKIGQSENKSGGKLERTKIDIEKSIKDLADTLTKVKGELMNQIANKGGGAPNRKLLVNSSVMSTKYTDVNFILSGMTATDDNTNKIVNLNLGTGLGTGYQYKVYVTVGYSNADYIVDGVADDVQLQQAMTYVNSLGGGTVYIKQGTYDIQAETKVFSNTTVEASSGALFVLHAGFSNYSIFRHNATGQTNMIFKGIIGYFSEIPNKAGIWVSTASEIKIYDCFFYNNATTASTAGTGIDFNVITNAWIENVRCDATSSHGIALKTSSNIDIVNCRCTLNHDRGLLIDPNCEFIRVKGGDFSSNSFNGVHVDHGSKHISVMGVTANSNGISGIAVQAAPGDPITNFGYRTEIVGNTCNSNTQNGIVLANATNCTVSNNICVANIQHGIRVTSVVGSSITGNVCLLNTLRGIVLETSVIDTTLSNNITNFNIADGIEIRATTNRCNISNNVSMNNGQGSPNGRDGILITADGTGTNPTNNTFIGNVCGDDQIQDITTLTTNVSAGANTIIVASTVAFQPIAGRYITISDGVNSETLKISTINSNTQFTFTTNLVNSYLAITPTNITGLPTQRYGINNSDSLSINNSFISNQTYGNLTGDILNNDPKPMMMGNITNAGGQSTTATQRINLTVKEDVEGIKVVKNVAGATTSYPLDIQLGSSDLADAAGSFSASASGVLKDTLLLTNPFIATGTEAGIFLSPSTAGGILRGARISAINEDGNNSIGLKFYTGVTSTITEKARITSAGRLGVGTGATVSAQIHAISTTGQLRLGYDASNYFQTTVGSSSNVTFDLSGASSTFLFNKFVGIGVADPTVDFNISGINRITQNITSSNASDTVLQLKNTATNGRAWQLRSNGTSSEGNGNFVLVDATASATRLAIDLNGNVGIGVTAVSAQLHVLKTTEQLRLGYDTSNYLSTTVSSTGSTTFALTGTSPTFTFSQATTFSSTVTLPTPFTLGATSVTTTGTQLNYLNAAGGTTGTTSTNLVFSTSPTLVTPVIGAATGTSVVLAGAAAISSFSNTSDTASLQVLKLIGARATPAVSDEIYQSFFLNNSTPATKEMARITARATVVTAAAENGTLRFGLLVSGAFSDRIEMNSNVLRPASNGLVGLGSSGTGWSNVFLSSGAAINWNAANMTLTHAAGSLTFAGGNVLGLGAATGTSLALTGKIGTYNNIATVSNGVPSELATIDSTGLTANVGATTLYAVPASGVGMYRVSAYLVTTTAASVSSTMPNAQVVFTDNDSNTSVTLDVTPILGAAGLGQSGTLAANTVGTVFSGTVVIYVKASTTIQYQTVNYASTIAGMAYALRIKLEAL